MRATPRVLRKSAFMIHCNAAIGDVSDPPLVVLVWLQDVQVPEIRWGAIQHIVQERSRIGSGAYGTVYRGWMADGRGMVAVKRLPPEHMAAARSEAQALLRLRRPSEHNLLRMHGCCVQDGHMHIVTQFAAGGCLEHQLFGQRRAGNRLEPLPLWRPMRQEQRLAALLGTARALRHLHEGLESATILHRRAAFSLHGVALVARRLCTCSLPEPARNASPAAQADNIPHLLASHL